MRRKNRMRNIGILMAVLVLIVSGSWFLFDPNNGFLLKTAQLKSFSLIDGTQMTCIAQGSTALFDSNLLYAGFNQKSESVGGLQFIKTETKFLKSEAGTRVNEILASSSLKCDKLPPVGQVLWYQGSVKQKSFIVDKLGNKILVLEGSNNGINVKQTNNVGYHGLYTLRYDVGLANSKITTNSDFSTVLITETSFNIDLVLKSTSGTEIKRQHADFSTLISSVKIIVDSESFVGDVEKTIEIIDFTPTKVFDTNSNTKIINTSGKLILNKYTTTEGSPKARLLDSHGMINSLYSNGGVGSITYFTVIQQNGDTATIQFSVNVPESNYVEQGTWVWQFTRAIDNSPVAIATQEVLGANIVANDPTDNQQGSDTTVDDTAQEQLGATPPTPLDSGLNAVEFEESVFEDDLFHIEICPPLCGEGVTAQNNTSSNSGGSLVFVLVAIGAFVVGISGVVVLSRKRG